VANAFATLARRGQSQPPRLFLNLESPPAAEPNDLPISPTTLGVISRGPVEGVSAFTIRNDATIGPQLGETIRGVFGTVTFATGAAANADAPPTCVVLEQGTVVGYAPTVANKATGLYEIAIDCTTGNGFEIGKEYTVHVVVTMGGVTTRGPVEGLSAFTVRGASSSPVAITNNVTTVEELRDHIIALIKALVPTVHSDTGFLPFLDDDGDDFVAWALANPAAALRRFQVRDSGDDEWPDITDTQVEYRFVTFEILVAYPQTARFTSDDGAGRDRDDARRRDQLLLEQSVGLNGYTNFTGATCPNAAHVNGSTTRPIVGNVDFLFLRQKMRFSQRRVP
jgi:hypothetical protein